MISHLLRELILPPGSLLLMFLAGFLLHKRKPKLGRGLLLFAFLALYLLSIPLISRALTKSAETRPALSLEQIESFAPQVIIVLGAGADYQAPEYGGVTVANDASRARAGYGAHLGKSLDLPVLATGGYSDRVEDSEAFAIAQVLAELGVNEIWQETSSLNTAESAVNAKSMLDEKSISKVLLVTDALHAGRAEEAFLRVGFEVRVAPMGFRSRHPWERAILYVIPNDRQFYDSCRALRAHLGTLFYRLRY